MTAKWDKANYHLYNGIYIKFKKNTEDEKVIEEFKKVKGDTYIIKLKNLLEINKK